MGDFFKSVHFKILMAVLIVLLSCMLRAAWTGGLSPIISQTTGAVITPLQKVSSSISNAVQGYFQRYIDADEVAQENEKLRAEINELRRQMVEFEQYREENDNLKKYLDIKEQNPDFELEPAAVVARDPNDRFYSFTIDRGSMHGVEPYDTVISDDGLVGQVKEVGMNWSKVNTILDVEVDVGAYDLRTRDIGTISGAIEFVGDGNCKLSYLPRESGAAKGDLVVTTGGGLFPKGLVVGEISQVDFDAGRISLYAVITPAADIRSVTDVMVIKSFNGQEAVSDEQQ